MAGGAELVNPGAGAQTWVSPFPAPTNLWVHEVCFSLKYVSNFSLLSISEWPVPNYPKLPSFCKGFHSSNKENEAFSQEASCRRRERLQHVWDKESRNHSPWYFLRPAKDSERSQDGKSLPLCSRGVFFWRDMFSALARETASDLSADIVLPGCWLPGKRNRLLNSAPRSSMAVAVH